MTNPEKQLTTPRSHEKERGKVGLAILMWMLGVPGFIIILYLLLGR